MTAGQAILETRGGIMMEKPEASVIRRPGLLVLLLMPLVCLTNIIALVEIGGWSIRPVDVLFVLGWMIWLRQVAASSRLPRALALFFALLAVFAAGIALGYLFGDGYSVLWSKQLRFLQTILWGGLALAFVRGARDVELWMGSVVAAGTFLAAASIVIYALDPELHRVAAYFSAAGGEGLEVQASYNEIAAIHVVAMTLLLRHIRLGPFDRTRMVSWGNLWFLLNLAGLVLNQSRSATLALICVFFTLLLMGLSGSVMRGKVPVRVLRLAGLVLVAAAVMFVVPEFLAINRLAESFDPSSNAYESMMARFELWGLGLEMWTASLPSLLFGYGSGSVQSLLFDSPTTDNFFLDHLLAEGVLGLGVVAALILWPVVRTLFSADRRAIPLLVAVIAFTVSLTGNVLVDPFYGGITFITLFAFFAVHAARNPRRRAKL